MANEPDPAPAASTSEVPVATIDHDNSAIEDFVEENKNKLILGIGAVLLAIIVYMLASFKSESGKSTAAAALTGAETVEELRGVISEFPNSVVAGSAELLIAAKLMEEDKADESREVLEEFYSARKGHPLYLKGVSDLGLREHVDGNLDKAVSLLQEAAVPGEAPGFIEQTALLRLGDALTAQGMTAMASDESAAQEWFDQATQAFEDLETKAAENSVYKRTAAQRKERLPHLSIKPTSPEEAQAAAPAVVEPAVVEPAVIEPAVIEPVEVLPAEEEASSAAEEAAPGGS